VSARDLVDLEAEQRGFTPEQRFFIGFARSRATNRTIEATRRRS